MKEGNEQNERIVSMASEKHAIRKEIDLSKLVSMHQQSLSDAWLELKVLKASQAYDSDSPEVKESKRHLSRSCQRDTTGLYRTWQSIHKNESNINSVLTSQLAIIST